MTAINVLLDSSLWVDYFLNGSTESKSYIESGNYNLFTSSISLHEIKKRLLKEKYTSNSINQSLDFIKSKSIISDITEKICEQSAEDAVKLKLNTADALIYRTAQNQNALLVTLDYDFKGLKNTRVI